MRKLFIFLGLVISLTAATAQESKFMAGAGLNYATEIANVGINIKGLYLINDTWEADAGFTYFFKKNNVNYSALDFNGHYVFSSNEGTVFYGLAGLNVTFYKFEIEGFDTSGLYDDSDFGDYNPMAEIAGDFESKGSDIGFNLGLGGRMPLSDVLFLNGEIKYTLGGADYLSIGAGIMYQF